MWPFQIVFHTFLLQQALLKSISTYSNKNLMIKYLGLIYEKRDIIMFKLCIWELWLCLFTKWNVIKKFTLHLWSVFLFFDLTSCFLQYLGENWYSMLLLCLFLKGLFKFWLVLQDFRENWIIKRERYIIFQDSQIEDKMSFTNMV